MARRKKRAPASAFARPLLSSLSSDWYWEQDAEYRFTRIEVQAGTAGEQELARHNLGRCNWETGIQVEGGWDAHRSLLAARAPFRELLMWRDFEDGSRRYISASGEPVFDAKGRFTGYRGVGRDITQIKRGEQLLRLEHTVTRRLAEARRGEEGAAAALRAICESENWDCGELWRSDEAGTAMRRSASWVRPGAEAAQRFTELSGDFDFRPGQGLVGSVWQSAQPLWIPDFRHDERAVRGELAERTGLGAVFLCPVAIGDRVSAVMAFACRRIRPPDDALLQATAVIAAQLGLFLRRADAEEGLRRSEESFRHTFELAGVGIAHIGRDRRFLRLNRRFCEILGYAESELIGKTGRDISHVEDIDHMNAQRPRLYGGETDAVRGEKRYVRKDGSVVWVAYTLALERDAAGAPQYEIAVYDDISARKAMEAALRENEGRFRSLTDLSSDFFWEQDSEFRFTRLEGRYVAGGDTELRERLKGMRRWESGLEVEGGWDAHRALLESRTPYYDVLMWRTMSDGRLRYVSVSGEPVFTADGTFTGYRGVGRDVTDEKRAEQLLRLEHRVANALSEATDVNSGLTAVMQLIGEAEGWGCGRFFAVDPVNDELVYRHGWSRGDAALQRFLEGSRGLRYKRGQGLSGVAWETGEPIWCSDTRVEFVFGVMTEGRTLGTLSFTSQEVRKPDARLLQTTQVIGAQVGQFLRRMQAEESLRQSEARFRSLTELSSDFFWETDAQHRFKSIVHGPGYSQQIGRIIGRTAWDMPYTRPDETAWRSFRASMEAQQPFRDFEFGRPWQDDGVRHFSVSGQPHFAPDGAFLGYRGVGRDITEIVLARERIAALAYHDALTGLDNRTSLLPALEKSVERSRRRGTRLAGLFLDLDGFKQINDRYGHDAGDRLLVQVAQRLRGGLRASDPVARLGGDEFFVVLEDLSTAAPAERVANKLLAAVLRPYDLGGGTSAEISASIGISFYPDDAGDAATLIKHADMAMYSAKQAGKNAYRVFTAGPAANDVRPAVQEPRRLA